MMQNPNLDHGKLVVLDAWSIPVYPNLQTADCPPYPPPTYERLAHGYTPSKFEREQGALPYYPIVGMPGMTPDDRSYHCLHTCGFMFDAHDVRRNSNWPCGRIEVTMALPGWSDLDIYQLWDVEPLGTVDATTMTNLPGGINVPIVRFWGNHNSGVGKSLEVTPAAAPESGAVATTQTGLYRVGGDVLPPKLIHAPDPEFPDEARRAKLPKGWRAVVVVSLIADAHGNPQRVVVVRHQGMGLDEKAVEAVKQYRFKPATRLGVPVPVEVNVEVNFRNY
jgi:TonB family protein